MRYKATIKRKLNRIRYQCLKNIYHKNSCMSVDDARKVLNKAWPKYDATCISSNSIYNINEYDLQIIVPVYNMENYIEECLDSIVNQKTKYSYIVYVINDESTDGSLEILNRYEHFENIKVISKKNGGVASARNVGLNEIVARYVMFIDSDDYLDSNCIEMLMDVAIEKDADIVSGAHKRLIDGKVVNYNHLDHDGKVEDYSVIPGMPWGKVYRSELFANIIFPENYWFEDTIIRFLILSRAKSIYYINKSVYVYRILKSSASHSNDGKVKNIETYWVTEIIFDCCNKLNMSMDSTMLNSLITQSILNSHRVKKLETEIQEAVFVLTREIINKYFSKDVIEAENNRIINYFKDNDFGGYKLYSDAY